MADKWESWVKAAIPDADDKTLAAARTTFYCGAVALMAVLNKELSRPDPGNYQGPIQADYDVMRALQLELREFSIAEIANSLEKMKHDE